MAQVRVKKYPEEDKKWPKSAALYLHVPDTLYQCSDCAFYQNKKCALFGPTADIQPYGTCGLWVYGAKNTPISSVGTVSKLQAGYEENKAGFSCRQCEYWGQADESCEKVNKYSDGDTPGRIVGTACCNRWSKK